MHTLFGGKHDFSEEPDNELDKHTKLIIPVNEYVILANVSNIR